METSQDSPEANPGASSEANPEANTEANPEANLEANPEEVTIEKTQGQEIVTGNEK